MIKGAEGTINKTGTSKVGAISKVQKEQLFSDFHEKLPVSDLRVVLTKTQ